MKFVAKIKKKENSKIRETRKVKNAGSEYKKMAGEINDKVGEEHIKWRESEENGTTARNALANNRNCLCQIDVKIYVFMPLCCVFLILGMLHYLPYRPGDKNQLMWAGVTAKSFVC